VRIHVSALSLELALAHPPLDLLLVEILVFGAVVVVAARVIALVLAPQVAVDVFARGASALRAAARVAFAVADVGCHGGLELGGQSMVHLADGAVVLPTALLIHAVILHVVAVFLVAEHGRPVAHR
jgi:hypothetical protein